MTARRSSGRVFSIFPAISLATWVWEATVCQAAPGFHWSGASVRIPAQRGYARTRGEVTATQIWGPGREFSAGGAAQIGIVAPRVIVNSEARRMHAQNSRFIS